MNDRFYVGARLSTPTVELDWRETHHLRHVLRHKPGDRVTLFDGYGVEADAEIITFSKKTAQLQILDTRHVVFDATQAITIATAVPKGDRFRWLVEKATELGVSRLIPLRTARSVAVPSPRKLLNVRQTVIAAAKQCGRSYLMEVEPLTDWNDFVRSEIVPGQTVIAHPSGAALTLEGIRKATDGNSQPSVVCAVGPEGGFTDEETDAAVQAGATLVSLGPRTLRTETAVLTLAALFANDR